MSTVTSREYESLQGTTAERTRSQLCAAARSIESQPNQTQCIRAASFRLPTRWGLFQAFGFHWEGDSNDVSNETAIALVLGSIADCVPLVRVHSQCLTGELLGSLRCDCGEQLGLAMSAIAREGCGILIYEHQEGRGIGLRSKLQAYELQDAGFDTVDANYALGFEADCRDFRLPVAILRNLGVHRLRLLSNNPEKVRALVAGGIQVAEQVPCEAPPDPFSADYRRTKKERMGHLINLGIHDGLQSVKRASVPITRKSEGHIGECKQDPFSSIEVAIRELRAGRMIVIVDDEDRENEGDLMIAAEKITPAAVNFMATHGRGLVCLALTSDRADELRLGPMASENTALCGTGFTVSIDAKGSGMTTGISAQERARTILAAVDPTKGPEDFVRPGHVFPLRSRQGGVLERSGHTEAAVDVARLAGLNPSGVICEILNDDGSMARVPDLMSFCRRLGLEMISVADLKTYRSKGFGRFAALNTPIRKRKG